MQGNENQENHFEKCIFIRNNKCSRSVCTQRKHACLGRRGRTVFYLANAPITVICSVFLLTPICNLRRIRVRLVQLISIIQQRTSPPYAHYINWSDVFVLMKIVFEKYILKSYFCASTDSTLSFALRPFAHCLFCKCSKYQFS